MSDIEVYITSALTSSERRVLPQWSLGYFKQRLELITGVTPPDQKLQYYPHDDSLEVIDLPSDDNVLISLLSIRPYSRIHVIDTNPLSEASELAQAGGATPEYHMTDDEYSRRSDTVLEWKRNNQLGRFDPNYQADVQRRNRENIDKALTMKVGDRCRVINIEGERRGSVRYIGTIEPLDKGESVWVGIEFDEPVGKNDGSIGAVRVFSCNPKHGSFVKPKTVEVGDFPEIDPFADSDEEL